MAFEIEGGEWWGVFFLALCLIAMGCCVGILIYENKIVLSQETADKICLELTEVEGVTALDYDEGTNSELIEKGELYCQIPSYDETHLIKVGK